VGDEEVLLEVPHRLEERLDGLGGALDDVLERRDPLEECSSNGISSWGSPVSSTTPTPERTRSFELQRPQYSSSSEFLRPQTWQNITES
jgi:hypothetical protein